MALVALPSPIALQYLLPCIWQGSVEAAAFQLNATGKKIGFIFRADRSFLLDAVALRSSIVATGASPCANWTVETVDPTTGRPTGTLVAGSNTVAMNATTGVPAVHEVSGLNAAIVEDGVYFVGMTWVAGDVSFITHVTGSGLLSLPYRYSFDGVSAHGLGGTNGLNVIVGTAIGSWVYVPGFLGPETVTTTLSWNNSTNPDERGVLFQVPVSARLWGALIQCSINTNTGFDLKLYTDPLGAPAAVFTKAIDPELSLLTGSASGRQFSLGGYAGPVLDPGVDYAITMRHTGTASIALRYADFDKAVHQHIMPGYRYCSRDNDAGALVELATRYGFIVPLFSAIHDRGLSMARLGG